MARYHPLEVEPRRDAIDPLQRLYGFPVQYELRQDRRAEQGPALRYGVEVGPIGAVRVPRPRIQREGHGPLPQRSHAPVDPPRLGDRLPERHHVDLRGEEHQPELDHPPPSPLPRLLVVLHRLAYRIPRVKQHRARILGDDRGRIVRHAHHRVGHEERPGRSVEEGRLGISPDALERERPEGLVVEVGGPLRDRIARGVVPVLRAHGPVGRGDFAEARPPLGDAQEFDGEAEGEGPLAWLKPHGSILESLRERPHGGLVLQRHGPQQNVPHGPVLLLQRPHHLDDLRRRRHGIVHQQPPPPPPPQKRKKKGPPRARRTLACCAMFRLWSRDVPRAGRCLYYCR
mmetsp:Transcript_36186/g.108369  ORF Transcript_36186/g.108369 Transcript_36186/m.108369 type:complete len:343 (-) Transcript_36186:74-1102(-)